MRASRASWPTSITASRAGRPRPSPPAARARRTCRSRSANAFLDSVPFMAVTGNVPTSQFNRGAFQEMYRHYQADFPSTVRTDVQEGVPADPRRDGAARGAPGLEDHDQRPPRSRRARRALRRLHGGGCRRSAERDRLERQYLQPLRRRSRRRGEGGRHAAIRRAAGHHRGAGRALWRRCAGAEAAGGASADSGGGFRQRHGRASTAIIRSRSASSRAPATIRPTTPRARPTCCSRSASASTTAPRARGSPAIPSPSRRQN